MCSPRGFGMVLAAALLCGCDGLLVTPSPAPGGRSLAITLEPSAYAALSRAGAREAFDDADVLRVVLIPLYAYDGGDPFLTGPGRMVDSLMPFTPRDTVRVELEIDEAALDSLTDVILGIMLKVGPDPLFVFADTIRLDPSHTTRAPIPLLLPVPASLVLIAERDSIRSSADSTRVQAVGLFATGDTVPDGQLAPEIYTLDSALVSVADDGTGGRVWPVAAGTARIVAHADLPGGAYAEDTVSIRVVAPPAVGFSKVVMGQDYACGLTAAGLIYCWGKNSDAVFGNGTSTSSLVPVLAGGGFQYVDIAPGFDHMCALKSNGVVACWGNNDFGQLGNNSTVGSLFPVPAGGGPYRALSVGSLQTCAIDETDVLWCWGYNQNGELGTGTASPFVPHPVPVAGGHLWQSVSAGGFATCGIMQGGMARCWGRNVRGMLGSGDTISTATPVLVDSIAGRLWSALQVGYVHTCAVESGTQVVFCWGDNVSDQLGLISGADALDHPNPIGVATGFNPLSLSTGGGNTCILPGSGGYHCWGDNSQGQLGGTDPTGGTWTGISASLGVGSVCGVSSGAIWCWGDNNYGQLGNGSTTDSSVPVQATPPAGAGGNRIPVIPGGTR